MRYLYVDNFRGFTDAFIPIAEVSFLVGENSTGKTSILKLFQILGSPKFWFGQEFDSDDTKLGHFRDIVSVNATNKSYFRIGFIEERTARQSRTDEQKSSANAAMITFVEKSGMPEVSHYSFVLGKTAITTRLHRNGRVSYTTISMPESQTDDYLRTTIFPLWRAQHVEKFRGMTPLRSQKGFPRMSSLLDVYFRVERELKHPQRLRPDFLPRFADELVWLAPIRSQPRRTYDDYKFEFSPEGAHTPYLIKKILSKKSEASKFKNFLEKVGKDTGLFESVAVKRYGKLATSPFELDVILSGKALNLSNVGYGVSQALPVLVELFVRRKSSWFAIQQPEVHLHPRAQAAMGEALHALSITEKKSFLVETHSDFLIDRFRSNMRNSKEKCSAQVLFFERVATGNQVHPLPIGDDGQLSQDQPAAYREFFIREQLQVLGFEDVSSD